MDCHVCCESRNKIIDCNACDLKACGSCCERYLLETHEDPHCMGCRTGWNRVFLMAHFTKTFVTKKLKCHREDVLLDREKSLLPMSQGYVDRYLHEKEVNRTKREIRDEIRKIETRIDDLHDKINNIPYVCRSELPEKYLNYKIERKKYRDEIVECSELRMKHLGAIKDINGNNNMTRVEGIGDVRTKCPLEECRGYLNGEFVCGVCEKKVCNACMDELTEGHECDPETVQTVKAIKKGSKSCPGCGTMVFKIDGCDQMWCTIPTCHTAFSWRTGKPITGHIHNPHYIQFQNENVGMERNILDIPCGGMPSYRDVLMALKGIGMLKTLTSRPFVNRQIDRRELKIGIVHMVTNHIIDIDLLRFQQGEVDNGKLRAMYLLKEIQEEDLKRTLQKQEKRRNKMKGFADVLTMFTHTMSDIFRNIIHVYNVYRSEWSNAYDKKDEQGFDYRTEYIEILNRSQEKIMSEFKTMERLTMYTVEHLKKISTVYQCIIPPCTCTINEIRPGGFIGRREKYSFDVALEKAFIGVANESLYTLNGKNIET